MRYKMSGDIIITQYDVSFDSWSYTALVTKAWVSPAPQFARRILLDSFTVMQSGSIDDSIAWLRSLEHQGLVDCFQNQQNSVPFEHNEGAEKAMFVLPSGYLTLMPLDMPMIYSDLPLKTF